MDLIHAQLAAGATFRVLSIVASSMRECVGSGPAIRLRAEDFVATLDLPRDERRHDHSIRQRHLVHVGRPRPLVRLQSRAPRFQSIRKTDRRRRH